MESFRTLTQYVVIDPAIALNTMIQWMLGSNPLITTLNVIGIQYTQWIKY